MTFQNFVEKYGVSGKWDFDGVVSVGGRVLLKAVKLKQKPERREEMMV
jgi:hypothetical protein